MLSRILMFCGVCLIAIAPVQAEPTVFFRGKQLTFRHYVYGEVTASASRAGTINLGYAHGFQLDQEVGVLRRSGGNLIPIGSLRLTRVRPGEAFGEYEGEFSLKREDIVIAAARELNLWQGRSRSDRLVIESLISQNGRGYDTGDVSPALLKEVGRDDDLIAKKPLPLHVNADIYSTRRPKVSVSVIRGAFRTASGAEDGAVSSLSAIDRELSPDTPTLSLETALARFVTASASGKLAVDDESLQLLAKDLPGVIDLEDVLADLNRANVRVHGLIRPK